MGWRRAALWSVLAIFTLFAAALAWLWTADLGVFKPQLERWVSEQVGRDLAIDGSLSVTLGRQSVLTAEGIRLQNADWAEPADMVSVGSLEVRLNTWSLISGPLRFDLIDLDDAQIYLTRPEDADPNWVLPASEPPPRDQDRDDDMPSAILIKKIDIDRVQLIYQSANRTRPLNVYVEYLDQQQRADDYLDLKLKGAMDDRDIAINGEIGTVQALLNARDVRYDLQGQLDTFQFEASGEIDDLLKPFRPVAEFRAIGPDIDDLTGLLGLGDEGEGDINLTGALTPQQDGPLVLEVSGNLGQTEVEASGAFSDLRDLEQIDIDLLATGPDLGRILSLVGIHQVRDAPFMVDLDAQRQGSVLTVPQGRMLFGEAQLDLAAQLPNFPDLNDATIDLQITGPDLERFRDVLDLPGTAAGPFELSFDLSVADSGVEILQLDLETTLARLSASGRLGDGPKYAGSELEFEVASDSLARLAGAYGVENLPDRPVTVTGAASLVADGIRTRGPIIAAVDDVTVRAEGLIATTSGVVGSEIAFDMVGPDLAELTAAFGAARGVPNDPYDIEGNLQVRRDGYLFRDVAGRVGTSAVQLEGLLTENAGLAGTRVSFDASGPAFEELIDKVGDFAVRPGPYTLSGSVLLTDDRVEFADVALERARGEVDLDLALGLPLSRWWADFDLRARGPDVRSVLGGIEGFEAEEATFSVEARGELRGRSMDFDRFDVAVGDAQAQARGELEFEGDAAGTRFSFTGNIPSLARVGRINGYRMRDQPLAWNAQVTGRDGVIRIDDLLAELGDSDISGDIVYRLGDVPELDIDIDSASVVFAPLTEEREEDDDSDPEFNDGRLIPDLPLPLKAMHRINGTLNVSIGELQRDALHIWDIKLDAELRDGVLDISQAGFKARSGHLQSRARIEPEADTGRVTLALSARDFAPGISELNADLAMTGDLDINLEALGADLRSLAGNANGVVFADVRGGQIANNRFAQALYGDLLDEIFSTINPFSTQDPNTNIECAVVPLQIEAGRVTSGPASFVSTDKIRIISNSVIDLKTEELTMNIRTTPRRALSISAGEFVNPYVEIVGTLAAPRLAVDEKGVLVSGGAAVATGGLSVLARAAWDRLSRAGDACNNAVKQAQKALGDRLPEFDVPPPA